VDASLSSSSGLEAATGIAVDSSQAGDQFNHQLNPVNFMEVDVTCINSINSI
jgi:hypothetical protein